MLLAVRYARERILAAFDWTIGVSRNAFEAVFRAWQSVRAPLRTVYEWATSVGRRAWEFVGHVVEVVGNSVSYVLSYLAHNFIPGVIGFVTGLLKAGYALVTLVARIGRLTVEAVANAMVVILEFGISLGEVLVVVVTNPPQARTRLIEAIREMGKSFEEIYEAATEDMVEAITVALDDLKESVEEMLTPIIKVIPDAIGTTVAILLRRLGTFRRMTAEERADARVVYGNAIDLAKVRISTESVGNRIIVGITKVIQGFPDQVRPFVTMNLINFDARKNLTRHTLIHELMHIWQGDRLGPVYMAHAIWDQEFGEGYNYGYQEHGTVDVVIDYQGTTESRNEGFVTGEGADTVLNAADGDLDAFNLEQQAQIMMDYFVRKELVDPHRGNPTSRSCAMREPRFLPQLRLLMPTFLQRIARIGPRAVSPNGCTDGRCRSSVAPRR